MQQYVDLLESNSMRLSVTIHIPLTLLVDEVPAPYISEMIEENFDIIAPLLGMDTDEWDGFEDATYCIQNRLNWNKAEGKHIPNWLVAAEVVVPHDLKKVGSDYDYSSYGWGQVWVRYVVADTIEEAVEKLVADRNKLYGEVYEREQANKAGVV